MIHIKQRADRADAAEIDVVNQKSNRRIGGALVLIQFANAAYLKVSRPIGIARPVQIRYQTDHILKVLLPGSLQGRGIEHRDAGRHHLDRLIPQ